MNGYPRIERSSDRSAVPAPLTLASAVPGQPCLIVAIEGDSAPELARLGFASGTAVRVEGRVPLGGPVVVRCGRARVALARRVAERVVVAPAPSDGPEPPRLR